MEAAQMKREKGWWRGRVVAGRVWRAWCSGSSSLSRDRWGTRQDREACGRSQPARSVWRYTWLAVVRRGRGGLQGHCCLSLSAARKKGVCFLLQEEEEVEEYVEGDEDEDEVRLGGADSAL